MDAVRIATGCYHVLHIIPPMVAHEWNFFVDEGLVDDRGRPAYELVGGGLSPFGSEKLTLAQAIKEKGITIAMDVKPSTVVYQNRRGAELRIIAGWRNQQRNWVMGTPTVASLADLRGRVIGLKDFGSIRYYALLPWLKRAGLEPGTDVSLVRNVPDGAAALEQGAVDAAFVPARKGPMMRERGFNVLVDLTQQYPNGRPDRVIIAKQSLLDQRPEWAVACVKGMIRSFWLCRTMPDNFPYLSNLERRLRFASDDEDERSAPPVFETEADCEGMPFPIDGMATGFDQYLEEWNEFGELEPEDVATLDDSLRLDVAESAFDQLRADESRKGELDRVRLVGDRFGY